MERQLGGFLGSPRNSRGTVTVQASFLGVGAPEAVMVGVVALVVFGPKGLAEAAKSLGKAARSLQPTIKELTEVSSDLKSSIEKEIGIDEIRQDFRSLSTLEPRPPRASLTAEPTSQVEGPSLEGTGEVAGLQGIRDDVAKEMDPDIEQKRAAAAAAAWGGPPPAVLAADAAAPAPEEPKAKSLSEMTVEELQAEIAKRKAEAGNPK
eukprot:CAMPEP_0177604978 /NCGR_PEP_ID=MMETSP0419_2-20121207/16431_1 /TAXON_ID=582737 /ORGANISM="Tetraselmis sp., Strain GSL018" /LENGTH=206 /DNA_ID=CAMNT_0019099047 /DNA_START=326 /DNA_END=946 /DNA_ORIENTATION=+